MHKHWQWSFNIYIGCNDWRLVGDYDYFLIFKSLQENDGA